MQQLLMYPNTPPQYDDPILGEDVPVNKSNAFAGPMIFDTNNRWYSGMDVEIFINPFLKKIGIMLQLLMFNLCAQTFHQ